MEAGGSEPDTTSGLVGAAVLGMSRSGTSAVAGLLRDAGFYLGPEDGLMPANEYNPLGYNENMRVFSENERILAQAGGSWFDPPDRQAVDASPEELAQLRSLVLDLREQAAGAPIVVKDPRIGVLLPIWTPLLDEMLHPVLVVRDPVEIAMSLARRDGTPIPVALSGWEMHTAGLLGGLAGREVTVVRYDEVLGDPTAAGRAIGLVTTRLGSRFGERVSPERGARALAPDLRHHTVSGEQHHGYLTGFQRELWEYLDSLPRETLVLAPPAQLAQPTPGAREAVRTETLRVEALQQMLRLEAELSQRQTELAQLREALEAAEQRNAGLQDQLESVRAELQSAGEHLAAEREASRAAGEQLAAEREATRTERDRLLESRDLAANEIARLQQALDAVTQSHSWRLTQPLRDIGQQVRARGGHRD